MPLRFTEEKGMVTAYLSGDIDHPAARELMLALDREVALRNPVRLWVDMTDVTFMDSSGIAVILRVWKRMQSSPGRMTVCHIPAQAAKVFRAAGIHRVVPMEL